MSDVTKMRRRGHLNLAAFSSLAGGSVTVQAAMFGRMCSCAAGLVVISDCVAVFNDLLLRVCVDVTVHVLFLCVVLHSYEAFTSTTIGHMTMTPHSAQSP